MIKIRLIDANKIGLTDFEILMCNGDYKQALSMLIDKIEKAPIAYDVDKVVEQLEETSIEELGINRAQFDMDRGEYSTYCSLCLYDAQKIVMAGGID